MNDRIYSRLLFAIVSAAPTMPIAAQTAPNVIVIISDDAGYADFGFMDGLSGETSVVPTPNLDALANRGVTFSSAYTGFVCSPSRAAITTGGYQQRVGYEFNINNLTDANGPFEGLPVEATTIWERMGGLGYTTGAVGKWHLGSIADASPTEPGNRPQNQGVDEFYGMWRGSRVYNVGGQTNTRALREVIVDDQGNVSETIVEGDHAGEYLTETFGQYGVDFIADHHDDTEPFFLYQAFTAPHGPLHNSPDVNDPRLAGLSGNRLRYASMMLTMDNEIGRMLDALDDPNGDGSTSDSIADDTMVIFINDNGGASSNASDNGALRGFKDSPFEGGMRVPMILAGAGVSQAAEGTVYDAPVHSIDILPTAFAAGGGSFGPGDTGIDGVNLLPYVNGELSDAPHDAIVVRMADEVGVRSGDWKLVKNGIGSSFELYNLATDVGESNNVAASNPAVVQQIQRQLTDHESQFDKPRFAKLNQSQDSVNLFDRFTFRPEAGAATPGLNVLENSGFEDGTAIDGSSFHTFEELDDWSNNGDDTSPAKDEVAARNDNAFAGAYRGLLSGLRTPTQVTDHVIGLGDEFSISLAHSGQFSQWDVGDDSFNIELFYVDGAGGFVVLDTINVVPSGSWTTSAHTFDPITNPDAVGRQVGVRFDSLGGDSEFAGLDAVELGLTAASGAVQADWSASGAWVEGGTSNVETMFHTDAFAGAILEFPVNTTSYVSTNDMTRSSGLEFMLNRIELTGSFGGDQNHSGTINGNDVLLTESLEGAGPEISVGAFVGGRGGGEFTFFLDLNLLLHDDLTISGDGDEGINVTVRGAIKDYFEPRGVTKTGASVVTLTGANSYSGDTSIEGGVLAVAGAGSLASTPTITVGAGATLDVSAVNGGVFTLTSGQTLRGSGGVVGDVDAGAGSTVAPGESVGRLTITGDYTHGAGATLSIEVGPGATNDQFAVTGAFNAAGGDLEVVLDGAAAVGQYQILDFGSASGAFGNVVLSAAPAGAEWDTSSLLTSGVLALVSVLPGDYNRDGVVDAVDYTVWRETLGQTGADLAADGDGSGEVDGADYTIWRANFGASVGGAGFSIPEPASLVSLLALTTSIAVLRGRRKPQTDIARDSN